MKTLEELQPLILEWAKDKNLLNPDNAPKQKLKLLEEVGETAKAILNNDIPEIKDGLGDIFVVLVILAEQLKKYIDFNFFINVPSQDLIEIINYSHNLKIQSALFCLNDTCLFLNQDLTECANLAWNEIKDRKGVTKNGTFLKN